MSHVTLFGISRPAVLRRIGMVGMSVFALSLILSVFTPNLPAFASTHNFSSRVQVAQRPDAFQALSSTEVAILDFSSDLWLAHTPFGTVPPSNRTLIASHNTLNISSFQFLSDQALSDTEVLVQQGSSFNDGALSLYRAPFGAVPSNRTLIDIHADGRSKALSDTQILVEDNQANLWLESAPFGSSFPPARTQIDTSVLDFQTLSATQILVRGGDGTLWLERAPFGNVPPPRSQIDTNVLAYQVVPGTNATQILVEDLFTLWQEFGPF